MGSQVVGTATLSCTFGMAPSTLTAVPKGKPVQAASQPAATVQDFTPNTAIAPFGMCTSPSNPQVAAATSAAAGVLTPQPCVPVTVAPWQPGSTSVLVNGQRSLTPTSTCQCMWGGSISVTSAGQSGVEVG